MAELTLQDVERHAASSKPRALRWVAVQWSVGIAPSYEEFVDVAQEATAVACNALARNPKLHAKKMEDELTDFIVCYLQAMGFDARLDSMIGGHCDLVFTLNDEFFWLAEAKKYTSHSWVWQGYQQLATRYLPGGPNYSHGGMLIYCFAPDTIAQMATWQAYMNEQDPALVFPGGGPTHLAGMFLSQHLSPRTGLQQTVLHYPVALNWAPAAKKSGSSKVTKGRKKAVVKKMAPTKKAVKRAAAGSASS
ncbi:TPA: hypothetical protein QDZ42_000605 [Stenotrophomonas maltophilia]|nr:hypothetical protein [Stenotrophomonas maltophilia]HDS1041991.1 hypothetical protein [Stenotrophomonas maltophilia]